MFVIYYVYLKNPSFSVKVIYKNKKALQQKAKGLEIVWLSLVDGFRTFKWDIVIDNIKLNQYVKMMD